MSITSGTSGDGAEYTPSLTIAKREARGRVATPTVQRDTPASDGGKGIKTAVITPVRERTRRSTGKTRQAEGIRTPERVRTPERPTELLTETGL